MIYLLALIGGGIGGLLVPATKRSLGALFATGMVFFSCIFLLAVLFAYEKQAITGLFILDVSPSLDPLGLIQLTAVAYGCMVGALVAGIRYALSRE